MMHYYLGASQKDNRLVMGSMGKQLIVDGATFAVLDDDGIPAYAPNLVVVDPDETWALWVHNQVQYERVRHFVPMHIWLLVPPQFLAKEFPSVWKDFHSGSSDIPIQPGKP